MPSARTTTGYGIIICRDSGAVTVSREFSEHGGGESGGEHGIVREVAVSAVVEPNLFTQGIAAQANTQGLNDGTIKSAATETDAQLMHAGLDQDQNHKVDWQ